MAKRPKGMSSREMAAQKAGGKLNYKSGAIVKPKVAAKPKSVSPLVGAGPLMTGQSRVSSEGPAIGPLLQNQSRPQSSSSSKSSNRSQAAKAFDYSTAKSTPNSGLTGAGNTTFGGGAKTNINAALSSGGLVRGGGAKELPGGGKEGIFSRMFSALSGAQAKKAQGDVLRGDPGAYNTPAQLAENRQQMQSAVNYGLGVPGAMASNGEFNDFGNLQADAPFDYSQAKSQMPDFSPASEGYTPFSRPGDTEQATALDNVFLRGAKPYDPFAGTQSRGDNSNDPSIPEYTPPTQEEISQQQNDLYGNNAQSPVDTGGATIGNRSGRGSGAFGTGKGTMSDDPYIKELRKAYSSNGGEKWLRKQFEELIAQLDPTYAALQKEGETSLNQQLLQNNQQLASVMNANNIGDSEFRQQAMARQQTESQTALGNLLAKLSQAKAQDASGYRSKMNEALASNADKQQTNQQRLMEQIQQYRQQQFNNQPKMTPARSPKTALPPVTSKKTWVDPQTGDIYEYQD